MFLRLVADSFRRRPRRKLLTGAALALGMAVATATISVSLDVGDRLSHEFRSLGANLLVTPQADSLPLEIGGVDLRPANSGTYLPEADLPKIKTVFWHNNITSFAPILETPVRMWSPASKSAMSPGVLQDLTAIGTWSKHTVALPDGTTWSTGIGGTNPWWRVEGRWFQEGAGEGVIGVNVAWRNRINIGDSLNLTAGDHAISVVVSGILRSGGPEDDAVILPISIVQKIADRPGQYRQLYVSALTKPEDDFARRNPATMNASDLERWSCSPYVSSIAYSIQQVLPGSEVRVIRRVAEGEGRVFARVTTLLWVVTLAALLAAGLAVGASSAASVIERRSEIGLMKALGAGSSLVALLLAVEQLLLAFVGGLIGYAVGILLARVVGSRIFGVAPQPSLLVLIAIVGLAGAVTLLGSALPLRRAAQYEPAPILRGE